MRIMVLKELARNAIPHALYLKASVLKQRISIATNQKRLCKKYRQKAKREKFRIAFVIQRVEVFNSLKSVFRAAISDSMCEVYLLPIPRVHDHNHELIMGTYQDVYNFCISLGAGTVIDTFNTDTGSFIGFDEIQPDYIFLNVPYTDHYPDEYSIEKLSAEAKVCYVPYAYSMLAKNFAISYSLRNLANISFIFAANKLGYEYCRKQLALAEICTDRIVYNIGFPRFDLIEGLVQNKKTSVLWLPRWTVYKGWQVNNEQSSFLEFHEKFLQYAENRNDVDFVIRPHPLMFDNFVARGVMTQKEVNCFIEKVSAIPNVFLDSSPDYLGSLRRADILLADFSSIVVEYYTTARPIVYCGKRDAFSHYDHPMYDTFYDVHSWEGVNKCLDDLLAGIDPKKKKREKQVQLFLKGNQGNAGERIFEVIKKDYYKSSGVMSSEEK